MKLLTIIQFNFLTLYSPSPSLPFPYKGCYVYHRVGYGDVRNRDTASYCICYHRVVEVRHYSTC